MLVGPVIDQIGPPFLKNTMNRCLSDRVFGPAVPPTIPPTRCMILPNQPLIRGFRDSPLRGQPRGARTIQPKAHTRSPDSACGTPGQTVSIYLEFEELDTYLVAIAPDGTPFEHDDIDEEQSNSVLHFVSDTEGNLEILDLNRANAAAPRQQPKQRLPRSLEPTLPTVGPEPVFAFPSGPAQ